MSEAPPYFLSAPHARRTGEHEWSLRFTSAQDPYLHDHLVHGIPTLPGTFMLEIAAEAAEAAYPGHTTTAFSGADFTAFVRPFLGRIPPDVRVRAEFAPSADEAGHRVRVTMESWLSPRGPDSPVIRKRAFRADVHLSASPPPPPTPCVPSRPPGTGEPVPDPYYQPDSPVRLTGIYRNTSDPRVLGGHGYARWTPELTDQPWLGRFSVPALLICSAARTSALPADAAAQQTLYVPRHIEHIRLHAAAANDIQLAARHGDQLGLRMDSATEFRAVDSTGTAVVSISGARLVSLGTWSRAQPPPANPFDRDQPDRKPVRPVTRRPA